MRGDVAANCSCSLFHLLRLNVICAMCDDTMALMLLLMQFDCRLCDATYRQHAVRFLQQCIDIQLEMGCHLHGFVAHHNAASLRRGQRFLCHQRQCSVCCACRWHQRRSVVVAVAIAVIVVDIRVAQVDNLVGSLGGRTGSEIQQTARFERLV